MPTPPPDGFADAVDTSLIALPEHGRYCLLKVQTIALPKKICCFDCPPGFMLNDELSALFTLSDSTTRTATFTLGSDSLTGEAIYHVGVDNTVYILRCLKSFEGVQCRTAEGVPVLVLSSAPGGGPSGMDSGDFEAFSPCVGGTLGPWPGPHPPLTDDHKITEGPDGLIGCGCAEKRDIDMTFAVSHNQAPASPTFLLGSVRITGRLCVVDPDYPYVVDQLLWVQALNAAPWAQVVATGYADFVEVPQDHLFGPLHDPEVAADLAAAAYPRWWRVRYKDRDAEGKQIGPEYVACVQDDDDEIVTERKRRWGCDGQDDSTPRAGTVKTVALDPVRINPAGAVDRTRTYIGGPYYDQKRCCRWCGVQSDGSPDPITEFGGVAWTRDWGKKPPNTFELDAYLRCRLGEEYQSLPITLAKIIAIRNIVGGPAEFIGDPENPEAEPVFFPAKLGEWNEGLKPYLNVGPPSIEPTPPSWVEGAYPDRFWVLRQFAPGYTDRLFVLALPWNAWPPDPAAGPYETQEEADAVAANPVGPVWCCKFRDRNGAGQQVGATYRGIAVLDPGATFFDTATVALDSLRDNPPGAVERTRTAVLGYWLSAEGVGASALEMAARACRHCTDPAECVPPSVEGFGATRIGPNTFRFDGGYFGSPAASIVYDFGDGNTASYTPETLPEVVSHTYAADGVYAATVTVANACGSDSAGAVVMTDGVMVSAPDGEPFISEPDGEPFIAQG